MLPPADLCSCKLLVVSSQTILWVGSLIHHFWGCQGWQYPPLQMGYSSVSVPFLTTLQSFMNTSTSKQRFWPFHEDGLIKTITTIYPTSICEFQVVFPLFWIRINKDKPCLKWVWDANLKLAYRSWCIVKILIASCGRAKNPSLTEFAIHHRLESWVPFLYWFQISLITFPISFIH